MKAAGELRLADIAAINARNYVANRSRYVMSLVVAAAYGVFLVNDVGVPRDERQWFILTAGALLFGIFCFFIFLMVAVGSAVSLAKGQKGILGPHTFQITPEGVRDRTAFTDTLTRWPAVAQITRRGAYLAFWISPYTAHVIPRHIFAGEEAFAAFERRARAYHSGDDAVPPTPMPSPPPRAAADPALWKRPVGT